MNKQWKNTLNRKDKLCSFCGKPQIKYTKKISNKELYGFCSMECIANACIKQYHLVLTN